MLKKCVLQSDSESFSYTCPYLKSDLTPRYKVPVQLTAGKEISRCQRTLWLIALFIADCHRTLF